MIKTISITLFWCCWALLARSQGNGLPLKEWPGTGKGPFIFYLSGDGGFNSFSNDLCETIHSGGYDITAMNSKSYFWNKKTPEQTTAAITDYLQDKFARRADARLVLVGYSFGADVTPFIINRLAAEMRKRLVSVVLVSPSTSTDFQVHWSDMFGGNTKRSMDVVAEINKMDAPRTISFFGAEEGDFPVKDIRIPRYRNQVLPGGHKFDGHTVELAKIMMTEFK